MKVRATKRHGNDHGRNRGKSFWKNAGAEYDVDDDEAERLIAAGLVEAVKSKAKAEK